MRESASNLLFRARNLVFRADLQVMSYMWHNSYSCMWHASYSYVWHASHSNMGWLRSVGSLNWQVSFTKEPYKRDDILQKRPVILRSLLTVATPYMTWLVFLYVT